MRTPGRQRRSPVNWLVRAVLGLFAAPRVNMLKDYEKIRRRQRKLAKSLAPSADTRDLVFQSEHGDHKIRVRMFQPKERLRDDVLLFFHGGGWVTGDVDSYGPTCTVMADLTGCVVLSVDYRMAPEHPFPAGLEDCYDVTRQVLANPARVGLTDPDDIVLVGDSAGGNLVAAVSLVLSQRGYRRAARQVLFYPLTHWDHNPQTSPFESVRLHGEDYRLTNTEVQDYFQLYLSEPQQAYDPLVSPLMAEQLADQPETLVITAELDLLRDEAESYARALEHAGTAVQLHRVEGALHGFITLPRTARSLREGYEVMNAFLRDETIVDQQFGKENSP